MLIIFSSDILGMRRALFSPELYLGVTHGPRTTNLWRQAPSGVVGHVVYVLTAEWQNCTGSINFLLGWWGSGGSSDGKVAAVDIVTYLVPT